ncbi:PREDICTED: VWFA and cache domain-containing protein 1-like, partial [Priapulus caudatus]|uniref:VWFA and cache domain-containing protein 1-like n=1 Tax=Priapulus caudatus TaxID=37621 RepID=A0ABM1EVU7_PRICU
TTLDGAVLIQQLSDALEQKYRERLEALEGLRASVVQSYREDEAGRSAIHIVPDCCNLNSDLYEEDVRFKSKVNTQAMCMSQSAVAPDPGHTKRLHDTVLDRMRTNLQTVPSLKWQYYGDENGVITTFPSVPKKDCHKYDPRFRYVWFRYVSKQSNWPTSDIKVFVKTRACYARSLVSGYRTVWWKTELSSVFAMPKLLPPTTQKRPGTSQDDNTIGHGKKWQYFAGPFRDGNTC